MRYIYKYRTSANVICGGEISAPSRDAVYVALKAKGSFNLRNPQVKGNASLFVIDDSSMPAILHAPENRWVMVNIAPLKTDKQILFEIRVRKELARGFSY